MLDGLFVFCARARAWSHDERYSSSNDDVAPDTCVLLSLLLLLLELLLSEAALQVKVLPAATEGAR